MTKAFFKSQFVVIETYSSPPPPELPSPFFRGLFNEYLQYILKIWNIYLSLGRPKYELDKFVSPALVNFTLMKSSSIIVTVE